MPAALKRPKSVPHTPRRKGVVTYDVRSLRKRFGLPQALLARMLDVSLRTVSSIEPGQAPPRFTRALVQATRLCQALSEVVDRAYISRWLTDPNEMLAGLKPIEAIERGQIDLVWQVVEGLRTGSGL